MNKLEKTKDVAIKTEPLSPPRQIKPGSVTQHGPLEMEMRTQQPGSQILNSVVIKTEPNASPKSRDTIKPEVTSPLAAMPIWNLATTASEMPPAQMTSVIRKYVDQLVANLTAAGLPESRKRAWAAVVKQECAAGLEATAVSKKSHTEISISGTNISQNFNLENLPPADHVGMSTLAPQSPATTIFEAAKTPMQQPKASGDKPGRKTETEATTQHTKSLKTVSTTTEISASLQKSAITPVSQAQRKPLASIEIQSVEPTSITATALAKPPLRVRPKSTIKTAVDPLRSCCPVPTMVWRPLTPNLSTLNTNKPNATVVPAKPKPISLSPSKESVHVQKRVAIIGSGVEPPKKKAKLVGPAVLTVSPFNFDAKNAKSPSTRSLHFFECPNCCQQFTAKLPTQQHFRTCKKSFNSKANNHNFL